MFTSDNYFIYSFSYGMLSSSMKFYKKRERKMVRPLAAENLVVIEKKKRKP